MKRIISLCAVLCMICSCLVCSASAVVVDGFDTSEIDTFGNDFDAFPYYMVTTNGSNFSVYFFSDFYSYEICDDSVVMLVEEYYSCRKSVTGTDWNIGSVRENTLSINTSTRPITILWSNFDIYDVNGDLVFTPTNEQHVLSNVTAESLQGALGEVLSMVGVVVPVVIAFFGIRKGVVWLFARIRGV